MIQIDSPTLAHIAQSSINNGKLYDKSKQEEILAKIKEAIDRSDMVQIAA